MTDKQTELLQAKAKAYDEIVAIMEAFDSEPEHYCDDNIGCIDDIRAKLTV